MSSSLTLPNPFTRKLWNATAQARFIREHGIEIATLYARAAGVEIGATRPAEIEPKKIVERRNFILTKTISDGDGRRYDGDGPPE